MRIPAKVSRVISLAPSTTEILYALGAEHTIVGVDRYSDFPEGARKKERVGSDMSPSLERIVALKPDLVFTATSANGKATVEALERAGQTVFVSRVESLSEVYRDIHGIAAAMGRDVRGAELVGEMQKSFAQIAAPYAKQPPVKTMIVVWTDPLTVATPHSHLGALLELAGGQNIADDSQLPFPTYSTERVLTRAPDVIVVGTHSDNAPPMSSLEKLTTVPAVRNKRVHSIDGDLLFRPGPRLVDGARKLAELLHP